MDVHLLNVPHHPGPRSLVLGVPIHHDVTGDVSLCLAASNDIHEGRLASTCTIAMHRTSLTPQQKGLEGEHLCE